MVSVKLTINQLFFHRNWFGLIEAPKSWRVFGFQSNFSMSKISQTCLFFSLKNIELAEERFLVTLFDYFHFWTTLIFCNLTCVPINSNQFGWKLMYNLSVATYLLPIACLVINSTTVIMLLSLHIVYAHMKECNHTFEFRNFQMEQVR